MDLFEPGTGFTVQLHDFNAGIAPSGLFWTVRIPDDALTFHEHTARLRLDDFPVVDSHVFLGPNEERAQVEVDVTFTRSGEEHVFPAGSSDPADPTSFAGEFRLGTARGSFSGRNASGFAFRARGATSTDAFAEVGHERNGVFLRGHDLPEVAATPWQDEDPPAGPEGGSAIGSPGLSLARALPNPALEGSVLEFTLGAPSPVTLEVFDLAGRRVATILEGRMLEAGTHSHRWDLRDDSGHRLAPGIYVVQWRTPAEFKRGRLAVLP